MSGDKSPAELGREAGKRWLAMAEGDVVNPYAVGSPEEIEWEMACMQEISESVLAIMGGEPKEAL